MNNNGTANSSNNGRGGQRSQSHPKDRRRRKPPSPRETAKAERHTEIQIRIWCCDCWRWASERCVGERHSLKSMEAAMEEAKDAVSATFQDLQQRRQRLDVLLDACEQVQVVLEACVSTEDDGLWSLRGGTIRIALAVTYLTAGEKERLRGALLELDLEYKNESDAVVHGSLDSTLVRSIYDKMQQVPVPGQVLRKGVILIKPDNNNDFRIEVFYSTERATAGEGVKVFGRVTHNIDALIWSVACEEEGDETPGDDPEVTASLSNIRFI